MNRSNIEHDVELYAFKGQTYQGNRIKQIGDKTSFFGGEGFTTSFADASTYASNSSLINLDLVGLRETRKEFGVDEDIYHRAPIVKLARLNLARVVTFGKDKFTDISNIDDFKRRFHFALVSNDADPALAGRIVNQVIKHNDDPKKVLSILATHKQGGAIKEYADLLNCDAYILDPSIAPIISTFKAAGEKGRHVMVLDSSKVEILSTHEPVNVNGEIYMPNIDPSVRFKHVESTLEKANFVGRQAIVNAQLASEISKEIAVEAVSVPENFEPEAILLAKKLKALASGFNEIGGRASKLNEELLISQGRQLAVPELYDLLEESFQVQGIVGPDAHKLGTLVDMMAVKGAQQVSGLYSISRVLGSAGFLFDSGSDALTAVLGKEVIQSAGGPEDILVDVLEKAFTNDGQNYLGWKSESKVSASDIDFLVDSVLSVKPQAELEGPKVKGLKM